MSSTIYDYASDFSSISMPNSLKLEDQNIARFKVGKEFTEKARINSIDFSPDGSLMLTSSDDDTIRYYNCEKGLKDREIYSKKYGVDLIKFTHGTHKTALHTSTKENDIIRYLSLHDNKYLQYFIGHEKRVVALAMSPADDTFLSASLDKTVRLWKTNGSSKPTSTVPLADTIGRPVANFDPEGLIFAIGINNDTLKLYDVRNHEKGPFSTIKYTHKTPTTKGWHSLKFSPNGKQILIVTDSEELKVVDAFSGEPLHELRIGPPGSKPLEHPCEASYTPDSQYIISGSEDGCLHVWSASRGNKVCVLKPRRYPAEPLSCVKFNPKYMLIGSASSVMQFWHLEDWK